MLQLPAGGSVLDVCTGTGDLVGILVSHVGPKGRVVGVDFSEPDVDHCPAAVFRL